MYRIRLASGEEAVYRSLDELAKAVGSGVVGADAEVFHKAGKRWLPIQTHPDYRAAVSGKHSAAGPAPLPAASEPPEPPVFLTPATPTVAPEAVEPLPGPAPLAEVTAVSEPASLPPPRTGNHSASRTRRLRIMLSVVMGVTVIGTRILLSRSRDERPPEQALLTQSAGMTPAPAFPPPSPAPAAQPDSAVPEENSPSPAAEPSLMAPRSDSFQVVYPAPSAPLPPRAVAVVDSVLPQESRLITRLKGTRSRMPSYFEAYADARAEMDEGLSYIQFRRLFAPSRFASPESLRATRRMVAAAGNILRVYRGAEVMLEQTFRPEDADGKGSLREPFETSQAARELIGDIDSLYGLILAQQGEVVVREDGVRFRNPRASRAYTALRTDILRTMTLWRDSSEGSRRVTMPRLLRALGKTPPPPLR